MQVRSQPWGGLNLHKQESKSGFSTPNGSEAHWKKSWGALTCRLTDRRWPLTAVTITVQPAPLDHKLSSSHPALVECQPPPVNRNPAPKTSGLSSEELRHSFSIDTKPKTIGQYQSTCCLRSPNWVLEHNPQFVIPAFACVFLMHVASNFSATGVATYDCGGSSLCGHFDFSPCCGVPKMAGLHSHF